MVNFYCRRLFNPVNNAQEVGRGSSAILDTIVAVALSALSLTFANEIEREIPILAVLLRCVPAVAAFIWIFRRYQGGIRNNDRLPHYPQVEERAVPRREPFLRNWIPFFYPQPVVIPHVQRAPAQPGAFPHVQRAPAQPVVIPHVQRAPTQPVVIPHVQRAPAQPGAFPHVQRTPAQPGAFPHVQRAPAQPDAFPPVQRTPAQPNPQSMFPSAKHR